MQNRTYGDLFKLIQSLAGVNTFTTEEQSDISRFINRRYLQAFNQSPNWARYILPSQRRKLGVLVMSDMASTDASDLLLPGAYYKFGTQSQNNDGTGTTNNIYAKIGGTLSSNLPTQLFVRKYLSATKWSWQLVDSRSNVTLSLQTNGNYYVAISGDSRAANSAGTSAEPWDAISWSEIFSAETTTMNVRQSSIVPYDETFLSTIGEFIRINKDKAFLNKSSIEYNFYVDSEGAHILNVLNSTDNNVYVTYKKKFTQFTTSSSFETSTENVPEEFFPFIAHSAYADFLRMDGQHQKAMLEEQLAQSSLDLELEQNDIINNNNNLTTRFSTYVNTQSR